MKWAIASSRNISLSLDRSKLWVICRKVVAFSVQPFVDQSRLSSKLMMKSPLHWIAITLRFTYIVMHCCLLVRFLTTIMISAPYQVPLHYLRRHHYYQAIRPQLVTFFQKCAYCFHSSHTCPLDCWSLCAASSSHHSHLHLPFAWKTLRIQLAPPRKCAMLSSSCCGYQHLKMNA